MAVFYIKPTICQVRFAFRLELWLKLREAVRGRAAKVMGPLNLWPEVKRIVPNERPPQSDARTKSWFLFQRGRRDWYSGCFRYCLCNAWSFSKLLAFCTLVICG